MIRTSLNDILTDFNCSALVLELTKFILYNKQQIPITFDKLNYIISKRNSLEPSRLRSKSFDSSEKLFRKAEASVCTLNEMFAKTATTFSTNAPEENVTEIALLFGGSILTPKQVYRIQVPPVEVGHCREAHSERKIMSDVLHAVLSCDELQSFLSKPLQPTSMFLLIRKSGARHSENWLIPKPRYNIPSFGQQFKFKFVCLRPENAICTCKGLSVYSDSDEDPEPKNCSTRFHSQNEEGTWFLAPQVFHGFSDVYVNGISISKNWLHQEIITEL